MHSPSYYADMFPCRSDTIILDDERVRKRVWNRENGALELKYLAANTPILDIELFGFFRASLLGQPLCCFRSRSEKWLLMLLALHLDTPVSREWLASTMWPDSDNAQALYNLRRCLTNLRKTLNPELNLVLSPTPQTLSLNKEYVRVDAADFETAINRGSIESLECAAALYRGPLMEDCNEEWAVTERFQQEQLYLTALDTLAAHSLSINQPGTAVRYLRLIVASDPLREAAHGTLMQALANCGDYSAVTQVYRDLRILLRREVNAAPSAETDALYRQLQERAKQTALPLAISTSSVPRRIPVPLTELIGREDELPKIVELFEKTRLVTLVGTGGIGKTRLSIAAAEILSPNFVDGVWFVELASASNSDMVLNKIAQTLGIKEESSRPLLDTLISRMESCTLLLILDNCEHVLNACTSIVDTLLNSCSKLWILATSREAFGLAGEHRFYTPALALPAFKQQNEPSDFVSEEVAQLMHYGGINLFVQRATQALPSFRLAANNAAAVLNIVQNVDGIPLAIELATARVRSLSVLDIQSRMKESLALIDGGQRKGNHRHQTLRTLIDWSYDLLNEKEKKLLQRLSVFSGGWTLEAAEAVCSDENASSFTLLSPSEILDILTALVDKSMVSYAEQNGYSRYYLLETVRQYARDRLLEGDAAQRYHLQHRDYFLDLALRADRELSGADQVHWFTRLEFEHDNLNQALRFCLDGVDSIEIGLKFGAAMIKFWHTRGYLSEGRECLTALLYRSTGLNQTKVFADALRGSGKLAYAQADFVGARSQLEESLNIYQHLGDGAGISDVFINLGNVDYSLGNYDAARDLYAASLEIREALGDCQGIAGCHVSLGNIALTRADYAYACELYEKGLNLYKKLNDLNAIAKCLGNLAEAAYRESDYTSAQALYEESLSIRRELGERYGIALVLNNLGNISWQQGDMHRHVCSTRKVWL